MGGVGSDKAKNLTHARDLINKAVNPSDGAKPGVVVLPVYISISILFVHY
jgi:hypothetical protein